MYIGKLSQVILIMQILSLKLLELRQFSNLTENFNSPYILDN